MYPDIIHPTWYQVDRDGDPLIVIVNPIPATDSVAKDVLWSGLWGHLAVGFKVSQDHWALSICYENSDSIDKDNKKLDS